MRAFSPPLQPQPMPLQQPPQPTATRRRWCAGQQAARSPSAFSVRHGREPRESRTSQQVWQQGRAHGGREVPSVIYGRWCRSRKLPASLASYTPISPCAARRHWERYCPTTTRASSHADAWTAMASRSTCARVLAGIHISLTLPLLKSAPLLSDCPKWLGAEGSTRTRSHARTPYTRWFVLLWMILLIPLVGVRHEELVAVRVGKTGRGIREGERVVCAGHGFLFPHSLRPCSPLFPIGVARALVRIAGLRVVLRRFSRRRSSTRWYPSSWQANCAHSC